LKKPIKYVFAILIIVPFVLFAVHFLYGKNESGNYQVFDVIGNILESADISDITDIEITIDHSRAPIIEYCEGAHQVNSMTEFKGMFTVTTENGTKNGKLEDDFALYLSDIRSASNLSVMEVLTTEQIEALEEIPAAFIYDQEKDILYFHQSGVFTVLLNVYGADGNMAQYEFLLPVEVKE